jgi:hypothetical protein
MLLSLSSRELVRVAKGSSLDQTELERFTLLGRERVMTSSSPACHDWGRTFRLSPGGVKVSSG